MEFKGTKGKWFLSNNDSTGKTEKPIIRGDGRMVCMLPPLSPDNKANSKLIACAPELLEMLKKCRSFIGRCTDWTGEDIEFEEIAELIKKATE